MQRTLLRSAHLLREAIEPLWVGGLALVQFSVVRAALGDRGERHEWVQFLLFGTLYPLLVLAISFLPRLQGTPSVLPSLLRTTLALACPALIVWYSVPDPRALFALLGLAPVGALLWSAWRGRPEGTEASQRPHAGDMLVVALVGGLAWLAAVRFLWWQPFGTWLTSSRYTFEIFLAAIALALFNLCRWETVPWPGRSPRDRVTDVVALVVLAWFSVRVRPFCPCAAHHWGVHVGPAELVRQGGWLLWDVPCQYGFLNTLLLAWMPTEDVWQAFYILNALLQFLTAGFLFFLLRSLRPGLLNGLFALAVALAGVFLLPGNPHLPEQLDGTFAVPNVGPFRFFWCYVLLVVLLAEHRASAGGPPGRRWLLLGCGTWLVGLLWSCDGGAFCTAVWGPAYVVLVLRRVAAVVPAEAPFHRRLGRATAWLALPAALVLVTICGITAIYVLRLGHGPDWYGYVEYVRAESGGFAALPIAPDGPVWALFLVLCALTAGIAAHLHGGSLRNVPPALVGAWGAAWSTISYFVGHSHESRATSLAPTLCIALATALFLVAHRAASDRSSRLIKVCCVAFFAVVLTATFGHRKGLKDYVASLRTGYTRHVAHRLGRMDPALVELLEQAAVSEDEPLTFADESLNPLPARWNREGRLVYAAPAWQPAPLAMLIPLPEERWAVYMDRFTARVRRGGWFACPREVAQRLPTAFHRQLHRAYVQVCTYENGRWQLCRYDVKPPSP